MPQTILIVDDEQSIVVPLKFLIEQKGYNVITASSGEDAVDKISKFQPDLILLDIIHPGLDGFEICRIVRDNPEWKDIRIIFVTTMARNVDIAKGLAFGADVYITKPFSNSEIIQQIRKLLNSTDESKQ
ncbi:MAG: response regulator [Deltaproteobacteria bacterium]|nr:response regulator [Deltaproteobacteria bacterium]MBW2661677.1 response regulator [Deltaproteobacteria bacterium]